MKNIVKTSKVFVRSLPHVLLFEFIFKLILLAIGAPVLEKMLRFTLKSAGINYLSDENMTVYLRHPVTILALIAMLFFTAAFSFVELTALAASFSCSSRGQKLSVGGMFIAGFKGFSKALKGTGVLKFLAFMLVMPFVQLTVSSGIFLAPIMPILRTICRILHISNHSATVAYIVMQILIIFLFIGYSYSLHYLTLTEMPLSDCLKRSREKVKKNRLKMMISFSAWILFILAAASIAVFVVSFVTVLFIKGIKSPDKAFGASLNILRYAINAIMVLAAFITSPLVVCWITGRFFSELGDDEQVTLAVGKPLLSRPVKAVIIVFLIGIGTGLNLSYLKAVRNGNIKLVTGIGSRTRVTAHRGFSGAAPENTAYAFEKAIESNADYIELDVQMTKDNQLVVFHDDTIERTTDGKGKLSSKTYDELLQLSAGSWFGEKYADAKIMLLSEVLDLTDEDIMLNIEIKNRGNITGAVDETVRLVEEYGIEDSCYISSFSYSALKRVKKHNPKIKTALIANVDTATSYSRLKYINAVSMNYIFVNRTVVNSAHQNGKRIFVWTVDRTDSMKDMIALGVDNIITDVPDKAVETVYSQSVGDTVLGVLKLIFA